MKQKSLQQVFHEHPGLFRDFERRGLVFGSRAPTLEGWSGLLDRVAARIERTCHRRNRPLPRSVKLRRVEGRLFVHFAETAPVGDDLLAVVHGARVDVASRLGVPAEQLPLPDEAEWAWLRGRCHGDRPPSPRRVARRVDALLARRLEAPAACRPVH